MPTDVVMPQMGESITEGTLTKWLKKPGDTVARDEPLFEISTDKVDAEIPSPAAGTLGDIKVQEGATVTVNTVVCTIDEGGDRDSSGGSDCGGGYRCFGASCCSRRSWHRSADAADGRVHYRGHAHQVAEEDR